MSRAVADERAERVSVDIHRHDLETNRRAKRR
jgi:hypothetical protein